MRIILFNLIDIVQVTNYVDNNYKNNEIL